LRKLINIFTLTLLISCNAQSQKADLDITMPEKGVLLTEIQEQVEKKERNFYRIFRNDTLKNKSYSTEFMLNQIDNEKEYRYIFLAEYWMVFNYQEMIPKLIERITDNREIGLENTADLIIWERIQSGDLKSYGHGGVSNDDLFKVSGRVNHLLKRITGKDFGNVMMKTEQAELIKIQNKWVEWLTKLE
jgi:hypothetical protein